MELKDLEKRAKTLRKAKIFRTIETVQRKCRRILGVPEPHDRFTPYHKLTPQERRERVARIRRQYRLKA